MLKATGIIRHIDELGRIVVPKELRKTLKIKSGTSMEIYTNDNDELIMKKYSQTEEFKDLAEDLAATLTKVYSLGVLIADNDMFITDVDRYLKERSLSEAMCELISKRKPCRIDQACDKYLPLRTAIQEFLLEPIIVGGDLKGAVVVIANEKGKITDETVKMTKTAVDLIERRYS